MRVTIRHRGLLVALIATLAVASTWHVQAQPAVAWQAESLSRPGLQASRDLMRIRPAVGAIDAAARRDGTLLLPLPDGRTATVTFAQREEYDEGFAAAGPLSLGNGEATVSVVGDTLAARLVIDGDLWIVRRDVQGHVLARVDDASFAPDGEPVRPDIPADVVAAADPVPAAADGATVDLLIVYTPAALSGYVSLSALTADMQLAVTNFNGSLANSGLAHRFRLVGLESVSYTESTTNTDLSRLQNTADGFMDDVHTRRDSLGADVVTLIRGADPSACGVGYVMTSNSTSFAPYAFNVVIASCAAGNLTLAHEVGHNMGLQHNVEDAGFAGVESYAYGYRVPGVGRTVMAYACPSTGASCARQMVFSSPSVAFPAGGGLAGTSTADNARALDLTFATVAAFRTAVTSCSFAVSPTSTTVSASGATVRVTVTTTSGCPWGTEVGSSGVTVSSASTTSGSGTVDLVVPANTGVARTLTVTVAGVVVTIAQSGTCTVALSGTPSAPTWAATTGTLTVTIGSACSGTWSVASNATWLTFPSGSTGSISGTVPVAIAANTGSAPASRAATVTLTMGSQTATWTTTQTPPTMTVTPTTVIFGAVYAPSGAVTTITAAQDLPLTWSGPSAPVWTATIGAGASQCGAPTWLSVTPTTRTGAATLTLTANAASVSYAVTNCARVTIAAPGYASTEVNVSVTTRAAGTTSAPFGFIDTPAAGASGLSGSIVVSGWALDDVGVDRVEVSRVAVPSDPAGAVQPDGTVYVGRAISVDGARPDVLAAYPSFPAGQRAGWGLLLLTNSLPNLTTGQPTGGVGTFTLVMRVVDLEGTTTELGRRTITVANDTATVPFGAIDTPGQGGTVPGSTAPYNDIRAYPVFGWALSPGGVCIPTDGSTIDVLVDGVVVGRPTYNLARADIAAGYPGYCNTAGAVGVYFLDASTLTDGLHTLAWRVRDVAGRVAEIGSRYFRVVGGAVSADPGGR